MAKPNYTPGIGGLATNRYDFESHINGFAFRHNAVQIDVNPAVIIADTPYITVADALNAISNFITMAENNGQGFITIGDGYDTYHNANGNPNYDPTIPSIDTILNPLFTYILNYYNNPNATNLALIPEQYLRIKDGGFVLIKSGTYTIKNTVLVPPGITIVGENFGTKMINQTSPQAPIFQILADTSLVSGTRVSDTGVDPTTNNQFMFARATQFINLIIADNFVEPISSGDVTYRNPQNTIQPLILQEEGSNLVCANVKFLGKAVDAGSNVITALPIGLNSSLPAPSGTTLSITNCWIDGFSQAVQFNVIGSAINSYLLFNNNMVRVYGALYGETSGDGYNCFINSNNCNIDLFNNYCYGNKNIILTFLYLYKGASDAVLNKYPNITIANNSLSIDRTNGEPGFLFFTTSGDSSIYSFLTGPKYSSIVNNNNNSSNSQISMAINSSDSASQLLVSMDQIIIGIEDFTFTVPPIISVESAGSNSPGTFTIIGQATTQAQGGGIELQGGAGASENGIIGLSGNNVYINTGSHALSGNVNVNGFWILNPQSGTSNSVFQQFQLQPVLLNTGTSTPTALYSFTLGNSSTISMALVEVRFTAYDFITTTLYTGKYYAAFVNDDGDTSVTSGLIYPSSTPTAHLSFTITPATGANPATCTINAVGIASNSIDWQAWIEIMIG